MAEILLYVDTDFGGLHTHQYGSVEDLNNIFTIGAQVTDPDLNAHSWARLISSIHVVSGTWRCFLQPGFVDRTGNDLAPGLYPDVQQEPANMQRHAVQSIQLIAD